MPTRQGPHTLLSLGWTTMGHLGFESKVQGAELKTERVEVNSHPGNAFVSFHREVFALSSGH